MTNYIKFFLQLSNKVLNTNERWYFQRNLTYNKDGCFMGATSTFFCTALSFRHHLTGQKIIGGN